MLLSVASIACGSPNDYAPRDGDIVFQVSRSEQSRAIQRATGSRYSHMGIVYLEDGRPYVFEAIEPVRSTPLNEWVARGEGGHFVVKRLRSANSDLTRETLRRMREVGKRFRGRHYDVSFEWSDERMYCSELVWKIYDRAAGVKLAPLQHFGDFRLDDPVVRSKIQARFGDGLPVNEEVISPGAVFESVVLETVYSN
jgi:hypothetical protein